MNQDPNRVQHWFLLEKLQKDSNQIKIIRCSNDSNHESNTDVNVAQKKRFKSWSESCPTLDSTSVQKFRFAYSSIWRNKSKKFFQASLLQKNEYFFKIYTISQLKKNFCIFPFPFAGLNNRTFFYREFSHLIIYKLLIDYSRYWK